MMGEGHTWLKYRYLHDRKITSDILSFADVFYIGPILPKPAEKLSPELEKIIHNSGDDGILLISFGSEIAILTDKMIATIAESVSKLKQTVVWKVKRKFQLDKLCVAPYKECRKAVI